MAKILISILLLIAVTTRGNHGRFTYGTHSGDIDISQSGTGYTFTTYDTLVITGSISNFTPHDISGVGNCIDLTGATISNASFQQLEWHDCANLTVMGGYFHNYYANIKFHFWHDCKMLNMRFINDPGSESDQPLLQFDWPYNTDMIFGTKTNTFYNDTLQGLRIEGFTTVPVIMGSDWNTGGSPSQINRSIILDAVFKNDSIINISRTGGAAIGGFSGTGFNCKMDGMYFNNIDGPGSANSSHNEAILWYGSLALSNSKIFNSYASMLRIFPAAWTGLAGYRNGVFVKCYNNFGKHFLSYSLLEINTTLGGNRDNAHGFYDCRAEIIHNTVDSTTGLSYNGPARYQGKVVDLVQVDTAIIEGNVIFRPEMDYASSPYSTDSASHNGYIYAEIGASATHLTVSHNYSARYSTGKVVDSTDYKPSVGSPLIGSVGSYGYYTADHFGIATTSDKGWAAYVAAGSPPSCTSNLLPVNLSTVLYTDRATLTWNAASGADSYDLYLYINSGSPTFLTNVTGTSYSASLLNPGTVYRYYVNPVNAYGAASCAVNYSLFTTQPLVSILKIYRK